MPTNGTVYLANGTTGVNVNDTLTASQLAGLVFKPARDNTGKTSTFSYTASDPAGKTAAGSATLTTGAESDRA